MNLRRLSLILPIVAAPALVGCRDRALPPLSHLGGLVLLATLAVPAFAHLLSALAIAVLTCAVLVLVAVWEHLSLRGGAHGTLAPKSPADHA